MSHRIEMPDPRERDAYQNCNLSSSPLKQNNANELKATNVYPYREQCVPAQTKCNCACTQLASHSHSQHRMDPRNSVICSKPQYCFHFFCHWRRIRRRSSCTGEKGAWKRLTYFGMRLNRIRGQEVKAHTGSENKCGDGLCVSV